MQDARDANAVAVERGASREVIAIYFIVIVAALVGAYYLALALVPAPKVGVINLTGAVGGAMEAAMTREVNYALNAPDIKSVVVIINSPGGTASAGHDVYFQFRKLREKKPVVASMDLLAASAAYQIGVAANEIYAKPASIIGNVGVIMGSPSPEILSERFTTTGPFKSTGGSSTTYLQKLDLLHADFRDTVVLERSGADVFNPLTLSPEQVATGEIWIGVEAEKHGLIDRLGSNLDAIERAAEMAGLTNYEVVDVRTEYIESLRGTALFDPTMALYEELDAQPTDIDLDSQQVEWPAFYQYYIPLE